MISTTDTALFARAIQELQSFKKNVHHYRGRFAQIFLALKFYQNALPSIHSGTFVSSEALQTMLDDLYAKASRPPNDCVLMVFEGGYLARTGLVAPGNTTPQNTWRNNFHLQKGVGCYAPTGLLSSPTYRTQTRQACPHLQFAHPGVLSGSFCKLNPGAAKYRNEDHLKWLRIDTSGNGFAVVDASDVSTFSPYVSESGTARIPIWPLIVALYHDGDAGLLVGQRTTVDIPTFMADFNLTIPEVDVYFDRSHTHPANSAILALASSTPPSAGTHPPVAAAALPPMPPASTATSSAGVSIAPLPAPLLPMTSTGPGSAVPIPSPILTPTNVPPPAVNSGWAAQQYVIEALRNNGWVVYDVSRQQLGYDLYATKAKRTVFVEVKSSLSYCTPALTDLPGDPRTI